VSSLFAWWSTYSTQEYLDVRRALQSVRPIPEVRHVKAGRTAERVLKYIVGSHRSFRGCHTFEGKRVPSRTGQGRHEIDMIVITEKKLYILECKNWSGTLRVDQRGKWIHDNEWHHRSVTHEDLVSRNREKLESLLVYLADRGITIAPQECQQRVIFMNPNLTILSRAISGNRNVITPDRLMTYLERQGQHSPSIQHRVFAAAIHMLLEEEAANKITDGLFGRLGGAAHALLLHELGTLPTWDRIYLYGSRVLLGHIIHTDLFADGMVTPHERRGSIHIKLVRNRLLGLVNAILKFRRPVGLEIRDIDDRLVERCDGRMDGQVRILLAGGEKIHEPWCTMVPNPMPDRPELAQIPMVHIRKIVYGKCQPSR
jgi:hypothetical protein